MDRYRAGMQRAIECARRGYGRTGANPIVGAVIVNVAGEIIAEGFHAGADHAEVIALRAYQGCAARSSDDVLIVTLEPCNHHGKTPPCVDAIIASGIRTVIFAVSDPNPIASGGAAALEAVGISVFHGLMEREAAFDNRAWLTRIARNRPFYTWKIAMTLDGRTSAPDYTSKWITSSQSREKVSQLRRESDAILVGTETVLRDNPSLIPHDGLDLRPPLRVVVGQREIPADAAVKNQDAPTYFHRNHDFDSLHRELLDRGVTRVLVESGSTLASAMVAAGCIDEVLTFVAPTLLGAGHTFFDDNAITTLNQRRDLHFIHHEQIGQDMLLHYSITKAGL